MPSPSDVIVPDFVDLDLRVVVRDLLAKKLRNLVCLDLSHFCSSGIRVSGVSNSLCRRESPDS